MLEFLGNIIYVVVITVSILIVTYCIIGKIGDEYRKNTDYASKALDQAINKLPETIVTCIDVVTTKKEEKQKKSQGNNSVEPAIKLSCKEDNWGII